MNYRPFVFGSLWLVGRPLPGVAVSWVSGKAAEPWSCRELRLSDRYIFRLRICLIRAMFPDLADTLQ